MKSLVGLQSIKCLLPVRAIKVALVLFVFMCMMTNIFIPRHIENKKQIMSVICCVANNIVIKVLKGCSDTLMMVSKEITKELYKLLMFGETETKVPVKGESKEESATNTSNENAIETVNRDYKELVKYSQEEGQVVLSAGKVEESLYRLYGNIKVYSSQIYNMCVLFFIIFIVVIRKRKEDIEEQIHGIWKGKTNLC